ncbi:hypothetical protein GLOIN_2v1596458 [Rhizophagus irregularis DAOM 181602=DAOM 197198]|uniref:Uncharacterized protein n=1 Tax=Rhizophagus irregularis (strain DAOM 181602 / DAOM 197198 / MUCL 43194) TaxID=747089 RepID=A0A2P4Q423_RHIID|nr:hypothetical protein GLOIN_2v1596458 [Rhizophagus irregularis DAOM 181602=DAOM 197198]POG72380.1 hypothetical protein GLOIN_2v1596458 [Rhizophagus irregularis DAOM 181602=DAOM 197198]GET51738.1 hypothetical protein GLOIN_2v1596458 [Rhizophagus irregularis DAOM 181602=DAOM 197198]|eukprot:XP_025179246.1 hypothetical protein GLOIN_2v1596458 [Rhizophagus irregularis DAOM 181602=DAOM 197198]
MTSNCITVMFNKFSSLTTINPLFTIHLIYLFLVLKTSLIFSNNIFINFVYAFNDISFHIFVIYFHNALLL